MQPSSPEKAKGKRLNPTVDQILHLLKSSRDDSEKEYNYNLHLLSEEDLKVPLQGRKSALQVASGVFKDNYEHQKANTLDRNKHIVPVAAGLSGLGKSRLLDEASQILNMANIPEPRVNLLVLYYNGHSLRNVENSVTIEASFSWRVLYGFFLEQNGNGFAEWMRNDLRRSCKDMTLRLALGVILKACIESGKVQEGQTLTLFLGIDEYHVVNELHPVSRKKGEKPNQTVLEELLDVLVDIMCSPITLKVNSFYFILLFPQFFNLFPFRIRSLFCFP